MYWKNISRINAFTLKHYPNAIKGTVGAYEPFYFLSVFVFIVIVIIKETQTSAAQILKLHVYCLIPALPRRNLPTRFLVFCFSDALP